MSVLIVGVSHRTAPVGVLEQVAPDADGVEKLLREVSEASYVRESAVLATCNRVEIYADVERFHGSVEVLSRLLCELSEVDPEGVVPYLYVHYDDASVSHLFHVAAGLDSMAIGEGQILGQVREALRLGQEAGTVGASLNTLFQQALRVGKRVHAETGIDRAAPSLVKLALDEAASVIGPVVGKRTLVVGAGAMAGLAVATLQRQGAGEIVVANRSTGGARRLAEQYAARAVGLDGVAGELGRAEVVVSCTGSTGTVIGVDEVRAARSGAPAQQVFIDLALPHDIAPEVADIDGVTLVALRTLAAAVQQGAAADDIAAVRGLVQSEIQAFAAARRAASITPTVVALRTMATGVVESELERLMQRLPVLDDACRAEIEHTVRRVADKLLHQPTVRVRELSADAADGAVSYAAALAELFALDPEAVKAVTRAEGVE
ncbi:MAG: glutamyl-tRNA reductase [Nocardioidaceae bacterium]